MNRILVAFEGERTRQHMTEIFESTGIRVTASCGSGAEVLRWCGRMGGGVVLCGYKLRDVVAEELFQDLPSGFSMLLLAKQEELDNCALGDICKLAAPVKRSELVASVRMLLDEMGMEHTPVPTRTGEEKLLITRAKQLLMDRNQMTEEQAHRFLQKRSMDTGMRIVQMAIRVLDGEGLIL